MAASQSFETTASTLVCVIGNLRGGPLAWTSLRAHVLVPLRAELAVLAAYSADVAAALPFATHIWRVAEPHGDWNALLNATLPAGWQHRVIPRGNVWGGVSLRKPERRNAHLQSGSGAIVLCARLL
jgi:hypothetical protein